MSAATDTMETVNVSSMDVKKRPLDKGNKKVSPAGKSIRLEDEVIEIHRRKKTKQETKFKKKSSIL